MKKFISVIITALAFSVCLNVSSVASVSIVHNEVIDATPVRADDAPVITFADDFRTLYFNGYTYYQKNLSQFETYVNDSEYELDAYYYADYDDVISTDDYAIPSFSDYKLTEKQSKTVNNIEIDGDDIIIYLTIYYKDGTSLSLDLLREDYLDDYDKLITENYSTCVIDFEYPDGNTVEAEYEQLIEGEEKSLNYDDYFYNYMYERVYIVSEDKKLSYSPGILFVGNDGYYYCSYSENELISDFEYDFYGIYPDTIDTISSHKVVDEALIKELEAAEQKYYEDDFGYLENDELSDTISYFFLILIFGVIPAIVFVISLIFAVIKKKTYRKLLFTVCGFTLAEIITFIAFLIVTSIVK